MGKSGLKTSGRRTPSRAAQPSAALPHIHIKLYGFFYEISSGKLTEVVRDIPA
jgi:carbonic anhydrase